jgi:hypothetical protein
VPLIDDEESERSEHFDLVVHAAIPGMNTPTTTRATGTILDDDGVQRTLLPNGARVSTGTQLTLTLDRGEDSPPAQSLVLKSSDPDLLSVPATVDAPAGKRIVTFVVEARKRGSAIVTIEFDNDAVSSAIEIYSIHSLIPTPRELVLTAGAEAELQLLLGPHADGAATITVSGGELAIVETAAEVTVPAAGVGRMVVRAGVPGTTQLVFTLPAEFGGTTVTIPVTVVPETSRRRGARH